MLDLRNGSMDKFFQSRTGIDSHDSSSNSFTTLNNSASSMSTKLLDSKEFPSLSQRVPSSGSSGNLGLNGPWPPLSSANSGGSSFPNFASVYGPNSQQSVSNGMLSHHHHHLSSKSRSAVKSGIGSPSDAFIGNSNVEFSIETEDFPALPSQLNTTPISANSGNNAASTNNLLASSDNRFLNNNSIGFTDHQVGSNSNDFSTSLANGNGNDQSLMSNRGSMAGLMDLHQRHNQKPQFSLLGERSGFNASSHQAQQPSSHFHAGHLSGSSSLRPLLSSQSGTSVGNSTALQQPIGQNSISSQQHLNTSFTGSQSSSGYVSLLGNASNSSSNTASAAGATVPSSILDHAHHLSIQQQQQQQQQQRHGMDTKKMRFLPQEGLVENVPSSMLQDEYGLCALGLWLQTESHLIPGEDLKDLYQFNFNKESPQLYQYLQSPLSDNFPGRTHDMDWVVPEEYHIRHQFFKQLADLKVSQLSDDTLFWIFYNCCGEDAQAVAAKALYSRDWRFNYKLQVWITRIPGEPRTQHVTGETSVFHIWEPRECRRVPRRLMIHYADLDSPPDMCCDKLQVAASMSVAQLPPRPGLLISSVVPSVSTSSSLVNFGSSGSQQSQTHPINNHSQLSNA